MPNREQQELFILLLAALVVAFVCLVSGPGMQSALSTWVTNHLSALRTAAKRPFPLRYGSDRKSFWIGFAAGVAGVAAGNWISIRDDLGYVSELGFPFTFFAAGDIVYAVHYSLWFLFVDFLLWGTVLIVVGYAAIWIKALCAHAICARRREC